MYTVTITRDFVAQHFLVGGDWGAENQWHSHHYQVEVRLEGATLDSTATWWISWISRPIWKDGGLLSGQNAE